MQFKDTEASKCRWSEFAEENWGDWDVIWERAEVDYQGEAEVLFFKDGKFAYIEWFYGSCSGCDPWEDMGTAVAKKDFDSHALYFNSINELNEWLSQIKYGQAMKQAVYEKFEKAFYDAVEPYLIKH
jgi:hypothetical protein